MKCLKILAFTYLIHTFTYFGRLGGDTTKPGIVVSQAAHALAEQLGHVTEAQLGVQSITKPSVTTTLHCSNKMCSLAIGT